MKLNRLDDYQMVDGKPHGSMCFGRYVIIMMPISEPWDKDETIRELMPRLKFSCPEGLEIRDETIIFRPPFCDWRLSQRSTLGIKCKIWGRAWRVHKLVKKGSRKYKKVYIKILKK